MRENLSEPAAGKGRNLPTQPESTTARDQQLPQELCFISTCSINIGPTRGTASISGLLPGLEGREDGRQMTTQPWEGQDTGGDTVVGGKQVELPFGNLEEL